MYRFSFRNIPITELLPRNCKQVMNWLNYPPVSVKMENGAASEIRPRR